MINLTLFKPEELMYNKINSSKYLQQLRDHWLPSWKNLWDMLRDFEQIANDISQMNPSEKNQFAMEFIKFLKLKFAEANMPLDKGKSSNIFTLLRSKKEDSSARSLASLILFYCYLCGVEKQPWMFKELETAKLINFIFYYNKMGKVVDIFRNCKVFRNYKLNLDNYLNPDEIVKHIDQRVIDFILRGVDSYEGLLRIYFLFLKDSKELEKCFLNRVKIELLYRKIKNYRRKELIEVLNKLRFATEKLLIPLVEDDKIHERVKKALWNKILKSSNNCVKKLKEELKKQFNYTPALDSYLDKRLNIDKKCGIQAFVLQLDDRSFESELHVKHLEARLLREIRNIGKWLTRQKSLEKESKISSVILSKIIEILYFNKLRSELYNYFYIATVPHLIETAEIIYGDLPVINERKFVASLIRDCSEFFDKLIVNFNRFLEEKEKVLKEINNLKIEDKQKVLEEFRDVVNTAIKKHIDNSNVFSDEVYREEIRYWDSIRNSKAKTIAKVINEGKYEKLGKLLNKNLHSMKPVTKVTPYTEANQDLLLLLYYHYLLRYVKEKQDKKAYEVIRDVLRKNFSAWGYAYLFDDFLDDLEFLQKLKWLSFMLRFWYDLGEVRLNTDFMVNSCEEEYEKPVLRLTYYTTEFRCFLALFVFPEADYRNDFYSGLGVYVKLKDIFKFL